MSATPEMDAMIEESTKIRISRTTIILMAVVWCALAFVLGYAMGKADERRDVIEAWTLLDIDCAAPIYLRI
jgi:preprotein translocase subunit SecG